MKKRSEVMQTLHAGCSKADPQTNTQTLRGDYNTLCSLARNVIIIIITCSNVLIALAQHEIYLLARCSNCATRQQQYSTHL